MYNEKFAIKVRAIKAVEDESPIYLFNWIKENNKKEAGCDVSVLQNKYILYLLGLNMGF